MRGTKVGQTTKKSKMVMVSNPDGELIAIHPSMSEAARAHGVKVQNVYKTCYGYKTTLNGLVFQFVKEND
jgi:hypothetical protein